MRGEKFYSFMKPGLKIVCIQQKKHKEISIIFLELKLNGNHFVKTKLNSTGLTQNDNCTERKKTNKNTSCEFAEV